jgi:hypothetical protein
VLSESYKSNPSGGGVGPRNQGPRSNPSAGPKEEGEKLRLADLQKKIDEAAEEMRHLTQDDQDRRPQRRELRHDNSYDDDEWYDEFHHANFTFDDASPLSVELQATPWPPSYKPP